MPKTPDDNLYCKECQSINVREVSRQRYSMGDMVSVTGDNQMDKIDVFVICEVCKTHSVCVIILEKEEENKNELTKFGGGATRSSDADSERYDLIPRLATKREALRMAQGARTHGERNWESASPIEPFTQSCLNHLERHLVAYKLGDRTDDHLAAIRCNAAFLIHFEEKDNDGIANSEIVGLNYPESPRSTPLQSHRQTHLDGSLPNAIEEG